MQHLREIPGEGVLLLLTGGNRCPHLYEQGESECEPFTPAPLRRQERVDKALRVVWLLVPKCIASSFRAPLLLTFAVIPPISQDAQHPLQSLQHWPVVLITRCNRLPRRRASRMSPS